MRVQHNLLDPPDQERNSFATLRHSFPKAAVAAGPNSQSPIRPFATHISDVSVADKDETALAVLALVVGVAC